MYNLELDTLELMACKEISNDGISALCKKQQGLRSLNLSQCIELTDQTIFAICANLHELKSLNISKCRHITDKAIARLNLLNLESLDATACYGLTSAGKDTMNVFHTPT